MTTLIGTRVVILLLVFFSVRGSVDLELGPGSETGLFIEIPDEDQDVFGDSSEVTRFFTLLQPKRQISLRASFSSISTLKTFYPQKEALKQLDDYESNSVNKPVKLYHNEDHSDLDFDLKESLSNGSEVNKVKPEIVTLKGEGFDISGHLVRKYITRSNAVVQVLFYAGHSHINHQHLPSAVSDLSSSFLDSRKFDESSDFDDISSEPEVINSGINNVWCAVVSVSKDEEKVFGTCSPSLNREGSCIASIILPSSWWPSLTFNYTNSKRDKPSTATVDYILVKDSTCSPSSLGLSPSVPDHLIRSIESLPDAFPVGSVNQLGEVKLSYYKETYEEVASDSMIKILIPQGSTHPNARMYIPVIFKSHNHSVTAFAVRVKIKSGFRILGAQSVPFSVWQISFESSPKGNVAIVNCFLRDQDLQMNDASSGIKNPIRAQGHKYRKSSSSEFQAHELFSFLLEVDERAEGADSGRFIWQIVYAADSPSSNSMKRTDPTLVINSNKDSSLAGKVWSDRDSLKLVSKLDIEKDEVSSVIGVFKSNQILNAALLTGKQVSQPLKVFVVSKSGRTGDVTLQSTCHSLDESSLKVSQSCTSIYLDGSEMRPSVNATIIMKYGSFTGYSSFIVWTPKIPLEIEVTDSKLSHIKGWKTLRKDSSRDEQLKTVMRNRKRRRSANHANHENISNRRSQQTSDRDSFLINAGDDYGQVRSNYNLGTLKWSTDTDWDGGGSSRVRGKEDNSQRKEGERWNSVSSRSKAHVSGDSRTQPPAEKGKKFVQKPPPVIMKISSINLKGNGSVGRSDGRMMSRAKAVGASSDSINPVTSQGSNFDVEAGNCRLRYQQAKVKVLTKIYAVDQESGREIYLSSRGNSFDVTSLVSSNIRILDPRILSFRKSDLIVEGMSPGKTQVQVISPVTGRILGKTEMKVAMDRETITHLGIDLVTGLDLQIHPYSHFSENIWAARVVKTGTFSSLYQEGFLDIKLYQSDGTVTSLDAVSAGDYHLSIDVLHENRAVAIAPSAQGSAAGSPHPKVIAINEGKDQLIHVSLEVPSFCQRKRTQQLAMSYLNVDVDFGAEEEGSSAANIQQNDALSKFKSHINRTKYSRPSLSEYPHSSGPLRGTKKVHGAANKDFNYHHERILKMILAKKESDDFIQMVDADFEPGIHCGDLTPLEIGMYSLLVIFSLAGLIFIFLCFIFALKFRTKNAITLPRYHPPQSSKNLQSATTSLAFLDCPAQTTSPTSAEADGRNLNKSWDINMMLSRPTTERSIGIVTEDSNWIFHKKKSLITSPEIPKPRTLSISNSLVVESKGMTELVAEDRRHDHDLPFSIDDLVSIGNGSIGTKKMVRKPCNGRLFCSDETFDAYNQCKQDEQPWSKAAVSVTYTESSFLYPQSEGSIRVTSNPFHAVSSKEEGQQPIVTNSESSEIYSSSSEQLSLFEENFSLDSSSEDYLEGGQSAFSTSSAKLEAICSLRKEARTKQILIGKCGIDNSNKSIGSTESSRHLLPKVERESLQRSAVEGQPPPIPARRSTASSTRPPPVPNKGGSTCHAQSPCGSDGEYLYGVVMKETKKNRRGPIRQSSSGSEEPLPGFDPPPASAGSNEKDGGDGYKKVERHPQATCSSAPDVPDHKNKSGFKSSEDVRVNMEPPPVPLHAPRRPSHRCSYSQTVGKISLQPPPVPAHSDHLKSSSPCNKPLPPSPSRKSKRETASGVSLNRSRSHSRPKSLSLKSTLTGGLSLVPRHLPSSNQLDSRNIDKEWEQATKGMNHNQLMEYFNKLKESSA